MYELFVANSKAEKMLKWYKKQRGDIEEKLSRLREDPRRAIGAHPLHGRLVGKWSCWLGSNIRMVYSIDDANQRIVILSVGSHSIY